MNKLSKNFEKLFALHNNNSRQDIFGPPVGRILNCFEHTLRQVIFITKYSFGFVPQIHSKSCPTKIFPRLFSFISFSRQFFLFPFQILNKIKEAQITGFIFYISINHLFFCLKVHRFWKSVLRFLIFLENVFKSEH